MRQRPRRGERPGTPRADGEPGIADYFVPGDIIPPRIFVTSSSEICSSDSWPSAEHEHAFAHRSFGKFAICGVRFVQGERLGEDVTQRNTTVHGELCSLREEDRAERPRTIHGELLVDHVGRHMANAKIADRALSPLPCLGREACHGTNRRSSRPP